MKFIYLNTLGLLVYKNMCASENIIVIYIYIFYIIKKNCYIIILQSNKKIFKHILKYGNYTLIFL